MNNAINLSIFQSHLLRCFSNNVPDRMMIALSGGVDSMCLAYLLAQYKKEVKPQMSLSAVTIDHGFRSESAFEAAKIGDIVRKWGITHTVQKLEYNKDVHLISNFEEVARNLRYEIFRKKCIDQNISSLLVAHTRDDQLETFLQRLQMNSTMFGLLGLHEVAPLPVMQTSPDKTDRIHVFRPLIEIEKSKIRQICELESVPWFEDTSNQDVHLTQRNLIRYIINEYVPSVIDSRPEFRSLTRDSLNSSIEQVQKRIDSYDEQIEELDSLVKSGDFQFEKENVCMNFSLPIDYLMSLQQPVLARWLFKLVYPFSSSKHFHWSYAKLERQAMPRLWAWLRSPDQALTMTYLNVSFTFRYSGNKVDFLISRQVPQRNIVRDYTLNLKVGDNSWYLFDRIWWLKIDCCNENISIRYSDPSIRKKVEEAFPGCQKPLLNIPVILDGVGNVLAVPTMGLEKAGVTACYKLKSAL